MSISTGFGNYWVQKMMEELLGKTTYTPPTTWYHTLLTTDPTDDDGTSLVEVNTSQWVGFARIAKTNNVTSYPAGSVVSHVFTQTSGVDVDFGTLGVGSTGCTVVGTAQYDASSSGNLGPWGPLTSSRALVAGDSFKILAGNLTYTGS